jgi:tetratricopeptide (TPR) repeat protein
MKLSTFLIPVLALGMNACQTGGSNSSSSSSVSSSSRTRSGNDDFEKSSKRESSKLSGQRATLTTSLSNSKLLSKSYSPSKANGIVSSVARNKNATSSDLLGRMSAERLSGGSYNQVMAVGNKLAESIIAKNVKARLPDEAIAELAISAMMSKKYHVAEQYIADLIEEKDKTSNAVGHNLNGILFLQSDRIPEAAQEFRLALKSNSRYEPAKLNLGFLALKYGDFSTAKSVLSGLQDDWLVNYAFISLERVEGSKRAGDLCKRVLSKNSYAPAYLNCGLYEAQSGSPDEARKYLQKAASAGGVIAQTASTALKSLPSLKKETKSKK